MQINGTQPFESAYLMVELFVERNLDGDMGRFTDHPSAEWTWHSDSGGLDTRVVIASFTDGEYIVELFGWFDLDEEPDASMWAFLEMEPGGASHFVEPTRR